MKLNEKQINKIREDAMQYMNMKEENLGAKDILMMMYRNAFGDENKQNAEEAADAVLNTVEQFEAKCAEITKDTEGFLTRFADEAEAGKTDKETCEMWMTFIAAVSAAAMPGKTEAQRKAIYDEMIHMPAPESTPEMAQQLREYAMKVLHNHPVLLMHLEQHAYELEELDKQMNTDEAARMLMSINDDEGEICAVAAMLTYIKSRQGEFGDEAKDMTIEQITVLACAAHKRNSILSRLNLGKITEAVAVGLLDLLGIVVVAMIGYVVVKNACNMALSMFSAIIAVPLVILVMASVYIVMSKGIDEWLKMSDKVVKAAGVLLKNVFGGAYKLAKYAAKVVFPKIAEKAPEYAGKLRGMVDGVVRHTVNDVKQTITASC